jgi:hypothetical protein
MEGLHIICTNNNTHLIFFFYLGIEGWVPIKRRVSMESFLCITPNMTKNTQLSPSSTQVKPITKKVLAILPNKKPILNPAMTPAELKSALNDELSKNDDLPEEIPVKNTIGKLGLMWPQHYALHHEAIPLLTSYATSGCPVNCGPDWSLKQILLLLKRGPHISALKHDAKIQLINETKEKVAHGYARVVRWKDIKNNIPPKLKISPIAMIPHKSKPYRAILDLSFKLVHNGETFASVNEHTVKMAKAEAMAQLGITLRRIVTTMAENAAENKPFFFAKLDVKDGFWRMAVNDMDAWNFCYVLPSTTKTTNMDDISLVVPNSLQMGWCESPPFFCAGSETARDVIETLLQNEELPPHRFEGEMIKSAAATKLENTKCDGVTLIEVFVDDFIGATNISHPEHLLHTSRAMLHGFHSIFPPPSITKHNGEDPISQKKMAQGEGDWSTTKEILGWTVNGETFTIKLPDKKCIEIIKMIKKMLHRKNSSLKKYQKLAGKLQHASFGIPGGSGLFSPIQVAMRGDPPVITLSTTLKQILADWRYIIHFMMKNPTSVLQLLAEYPAYVGYSDACGVGVGGIWTSGLTHIKPFVWKYEWPRDIQDTIISSTNPKGTLTINDLELAGTVLNWLALECQPVNLKFQHIGMFCDNAAAVSWTASLRTSKSKSAGRLLRMLGMRIHARFASSLTPLHIPGEENDMADIASRAFKNGKFFHAEKNLTSFFNSNFPLPKPESWTEFTLPTKLVLRVISCLRGELLPMESLLRLPGIDKNIGDTGANIQPSAKSIRSSPISPDLRETQSYQALLRGSGQACTVEELKLKFRPSRTASRPSPRPLNWLENRAPFTKTAPAHTQQT